MLTDQKRKKFHTMQYLCVILYLCNHILFNKKNYDIFFRIRKTTYTHKFNSTSSASTVTFASTTNYEWFPSGVSTGSNSEVVRKKRKTEEPPMTSFLVRFVDKQNIDKHIVKTIFDTNVSDVQKMS